MATRTRPKSSRSQLMGALSGVVLTVLLSSCAANAGSDDTPSEEITEAPMSSMEEQVLGNWLSDEAGDPHLEFSEDGTVSGTDGCNGLAGDYVVEEEAVSVKLGASTLKACQGVDDWLRGVKTVTVDDDMMTVMNADGDEIGQLQRSDAAAE